MRRARKIRERMCGSDDLFESIPDKPKNMHWKTYWQLHDRAKHAKTLSMLAMGKRLGIHF